MLILEMIEILQVYVKLIIYYIMIVVEIIDVYIFFMFVRFLINLVLFDMIKILQLGKEFLFEFKKFGIKGIESDIQKIIQLYGKCIKLQFF